MAEGEEGGSPAEMTVTLARGLGTTLSPPPAAMLEGSGWAPTPFAAALVVPAALQRKKYTATPMATPISVVTMGTPM